MLTFLGRTTEQEAAEFLSQHNGVQRGSLSADGLRRVMSEATGDQLQVHRAAFAEIAVGDTLSSPRMQLEEQPLPCIHRGSQRKTCCNSALLWICRKHRLDCTVNDSERSRLQSMVATEEAQHVLSCSSCLTRVADAAMAAIVQNPIDTNLKITIVIAFSGRWSAWERLRAWILNQTWPQEQLTLLLMNGMPEQLKVDQLKLDGWRGEISIKCSSAGTRSIANSVRINRTDIENEISIAVAQLYSDAIEFITDELILFLEDDIIPQDLNILETMFRAMDYDVAAVSGVYRRRYTDNKCCAFNLPCIGDDSFKPLEGIGIEEVDGSGFGCLLTRLSLLKQFPIASKSPPGFDVQFCQQVRDARQGRWLIHREVQCEHLIPGYGAPVPEATPVQIAPRRHELFNLNPWEGYCKKKPWEYRVAVAIPVLDAADAVSAIVEVLRAQTERPLITLIDTGSCPEQLQALQSLAAEDCEVHSLRMNGVIHPSDFPAIAMDLAFSLCRQEYLLATHADCFLTGRDVIRELVTLCNEDTPVVGYELTERPHSDWPGMVGHTLTMFHMKTMDRLNAGWSLRRLVAQYDHPDGKGATHTVNPATSPNWPDTEILINYQLRKAGIKPLIIGTEKNAQRTVDDRIDHCRSVASATLYSGASAYARESNSWLQDGIKNARARVAQWKAER